MPSLYQITSVTLSCAPRGDDDNVVGNKSHGNVTSNPVALCTSDNGPRSRYNVCLCEKKGHKMKN